MKVKGGRYGERAAVRGIGRYEVESKSDDANDPDCDDVATMWRRCPSGGLSHGKTAFKNSRWREGKHSTVKFHVTGDSSHCTCLAKARGTSASKS